MGAAVARGVVEAVVVASPGCAWYGHCRQGNGKSDDTGGAARDPGAKYRRQFERAAAGRAPGICCEVEGLAGTPAVAAWAGPFRPGQAGSER
jgi:hypothetical protein